MANVLYLKNREEKRLLAGHLWLFSNEIDTKRSPLSNFSAGEQVEIHSHYDRFLGMAYVNPHSLISARIYSYKSAKLNEALLSKRINTALSLRRSLYSEPYYRLINSEGDFLPGLVIDRYGETAIVQITTAGMEQVKDAIRQVLMQLEGVSNVIFQNDSNMRRLENLSIENDEDSEFPASLSIHENGAQFKIIRDKGQKTGWFYDQRENRAQFKKYTQDKRVLDVCSYAGGWSIAALMAGASEVVAVDSSKHALAMATENAQLNNVQERFSTQQGTAFDVLESLAQSGQKFDVIVTDPPAFIKRKKDFKTGLKGYEKLSRLACRILQPDGILVSCSCSQNMPREMLKKITQTAASKQGKFAQVLEHGYQAPDHPIHPTMPETEYLKVIFSRITTMD